VDKGGKFSGQKLKTDALDSAVLDIIEKAVAEISFGSITLVVQDAHLIQMEKVEKVRFSDFKAVKPKPDASGVVKAKVLEALKGLKFGQVTMAVKEGKLVQIERTEKQRFSSLQGVYGDGI
jgi:hypothetical protein